MPGRFELLALVAPLVLGVLVASCEHPEERTRENVCEDWADRQDACDNSDNTNHEALVNSCLADVNADTFYGDRCFEAGLDLLECQAESCEAVQGSGNHCQAERDHKTEVCVE